MDYFDIFFSEYKGNQEGFDKFHNQVINMPRDAFGSTGLKKIQTLAGYLLLLENKIPDEGISIKQMMFMISEEIKTTNQNIFRDETLEKRYFVFDNINDHYEKEGRMFRHLILLCNFFDFVQSATRQKKQINFEKCREYYLSSEKILLPLARNNLIQINIKSNDFFKSLSGIEIDENSDYKPCFAILKYIEKMNRPVTKFEISVLLGRIDNLKTEQEIIERAYKVGSILPSDLEDQINFFFKNMNWIHQNGVLYQYANSQEPYFKFNSFILYMESFGLIEKTDIREKFTLTDYSKQILSDDISYLIADLENLIEVVEDYDSGNKELTDLIINQRNPELLRLAKEDDTFIEKMNFRVLLNPEYDKDGKRKRNRLIVELAKILADYKCQYEEKHMFKTMKGTYYCEAHHILEFNTENGPDIINNLVVLGPFAHMAAHHGDKQERDNIYTTLVKNNYIEYKNIEEMVTKYNCLTIEQIEILNSKKVINNLEAEKLKKLIEE